MLEIKSKVAVYLLNDSLDRKLCLFLGYAADNSVFALPRSATLVLCRGRHPQKELGVATNSSPSGTKSWCLTAVLTRESRSVRGVVVGE
jgi:hypothetical protein